VETASDILVKTAARDGFSSLPAWLARLMVKQPESAVVRTCTTGKGRGARDRPAVMRRKNWGLGLALGATLSAYGCGTDERQYNMPVLNPAGTTSTESDSPGVSGVDATDDSA
jgi:hypothetical protein